MTPTDPAKTNLYGLDATEIAALPVLSGQPAYRARQIVHWLYTGGVQDLAAMTDLPISLRLSLERHATIDRIQPVEVRMAPGGTATKYVFALKDERLVEAVSIHEGPRETLCVSSQAGCPFGCIFCATATMGPGRNLTTGEILGQVAALRLHPSHGRDTAATPNLVFMGMGEPLANYEAVVKALRLLCAEEGFGFPPRRITLSTVGLEPEIRRLAKEPFRVRLAFSLNATTDETRSELMPINRRYPFREVLEALRDYQHRKRTRVTLEYLLLRGVNDTPADARRLAKFARNLDCRVNLIAYNRHRFASFQPVSDPQIEVFRREMRPHLGPVTVTVRRSKGGEIEAACGQLSAAGHSTRRREALPEADPPRTCM